MLRDYHVNDLSQMCRIWNAVVAQGNAFPQLEQLDEQSGDVFFSSQSKTRVCIDEDTVVGLYILHPNNVGRCDIYAMPALLWIRSKEESISAKRWCWTV